MSLYQCRLFHLKYLGFRAEKTKGFICSPNSLDVHVFVTPTFLLHPGNRKHFQQLLTLCKLDQRTIHKVFPQSWARAWNLEIVNAASGGCSCKCRVRNLQDFDWSLTGWGRALAAATKLDLCLPQKESPPPLRLKWNITRSQYYIKFLLISSCFYRYQYFKPSVFTKVDFTTHICKKKIYI